MDIKPSNKATGPDRGKDFLSRVLPSAFSYHNPKSFVNYLRKKRMELFRQVIDRIPSPSSDIQILDIGGSLFYWRMTGMLPMTRMQVTLLNLKAELIPDEIKGFTSMAGDAAALPFDSGRFDLVFSNSVIEHMGSTPRQEQMANEVRRVGLRYFIQTPSIWFPLEPHARILFFQFYPVFLRSVLIRYGHVNYFPSKPTLKECRQVSDSTLLMGRRRFQELFYDADRIITERLCGLTKSYIAIKEDVQ